MPSLRADPASATIRAAKLAAGGHLLIYGVAGNGKRHTIRRLCTTMRAEAGAVVLRLSCHRLLAAQRGGQPLASLLEGVFSRAKACACSLIVLEALELLCQRPAGAVSPASQSNQSIQKDINI